MKVAIHQPNFLPWLGYFNKIKEADVFVILDDVEYTKNSFINRNSIVINNEKKWLTVPVKYSGNSVALINEIKMVNYKNEATRILKTLQMNYGKSPFFNNVFQEIEKIFNLVNSNNLYELNIALINFICKKCDIKTNFVMSSELQVQSTSTMRLIDLIKKVHGTTYIHGTGGSLDYLDKNMFKSQNINITKSNFKIQNYPQKTSEFISHLSIIDALFNVGFEGVKKLI